MFLSVCVVLGRLDERGPDQEVTLLVATPRLQGVSRGVGKCFSNAIVGCELDCVELM